LSSATAANSKGFFVVVDSEEKVLLTPVTVWCETLAAFATSVPMPMGNVVASTHVSASRAWFLEAAPNARLTSLLFRLLSEVVSR
jgi:hypothetical protein